ncbi:MAG: hypothetical protein WD770_10215 [Actinomycetota bacterium]
MAQSECGHAGCTCMGDPYCSDYCRDHGDHGDDHGCECGHPECAGTPAAT